MATYTSVAGGNWSNTANWNPSTGYPGNANTSDVAIIAGHAMTFDVTNMMTTAASGISIQMQANSSITASTSAGSYILPINASDITTSGSGCTINAGSSGTAYPANCFFEIRLVATGSTITLGSDALRLNFYCQPIADYMYAYIEAAPGSNSSKRFILVEQNDTNVKLRTVAEDGTTAEAHGFSAGADVVLTRIPENHPLHGARVRVEAVSTTVATNDTMTLRWYDSGKIIIDAATLGWPSITTGVVSKHAAVASGTRVYLDRDPGTDWNTTRTVGIFDAGRATAANQTVKTPTAWNRASPRWYFDFTGGITVSAGGVVALRYRNVQITSNLASMGSWITGTGGVATQVASVLECGFIAGTSCTMNNTMMFSGSFTMSRGCFFGAGGAFVGVIWNGSAHWASITGGVIGGMNSALYSGSGRNPSDLYVLKISGGMFVGNVSVVRGPAYTGKLLAEISGGYFINNATPVTNGGSGGASPIKISGGIFRANSTAVQEFGYLITGGIFINNTAAIGSAYSFTVKGSGNSIQLLSNDTAIIYARGACRIQDVKVYGNNYTLRNNVGLQLSGGVYRSNANVLRELQDVDADGVYLEHASNTTLLSTVTGSARETYYSRGGAFTVRNYNNVAGDIRVWSGAGTISGNDGSGVFSGIGIPKAYVFTPVSTSDYYGMPLVFEEELYCRAGSVISVHWAAKKAAANAWTVQPTCQIFPSWADPFDGGTPLYTQASPNDTNINEYTGTATATVDGYYKVRFYIEKQQSGSSSAQIGWDITVQTGGGGINGFGGLIN